MKVAAGARNDAVVRAGAEGLEFRWGPVIDGAVLPADPNASPISKDVPVIVGATRTERTIYEVDGAAYDRLTEPELLAKVTELVGADHAPGVIAAYRREKPARVALRARLLHRHRRAGARRAGRGAQREEPGADVGLPLGLGDAGDVPARAPHHGDPVRDEPPRRLHVDDRAHHRGDAAARGAGLGGVGGAGDAPAIPTTKVCPSGRRTPKQNRAVMLFDSPCRVEKDPGAELRRQLLPGVASRPRGPFGGPV